MLLSKKAFISIIFSEDKVYGFLPGDLAQHNDGADDDEFGFDDWWDEVSDDDEQQPPVRYYMCCIFSALRHRIIQSFF